MRFVYSFGYQTPQQVEAQRANEWWDDEDSWAVYIEAEDRDAGVRLGPDDRGRVRSPALRAGER